MSVLEKAAYLKGLADGLELDSATKEGKLLLAIVDAFGEIAEEVDALGENALDIAEEIDALSEDMSDIEEIIFGDDDCDCDDDDDCDCCCDDDCCDDGDLVYEVECPACGEEIVIEDEQLESGEILCAKCGEKLELVFDEDDEEENSED